MSVEQQFAAIMAGIGEVRAGQHDAREQIEDLRKRVDRLESRATLAGGALGTAAASTIVAIAEIIRRVG